MPLSLKYSPMAQPEYGARYCRGAASEAVALTMTVYFMASTEKITVYKPAIYILLYLYINTSKFLNATKE